MSFCKPQHCIPPPPPCIPVCPPPPPCIPVCPPPPPCIPVCPPPPPSTCNTHHWGSAGVYPVPIVNPYPQQGMGGCTVPPGSGCPPPSSGCMTIYQPR